MANRVPSKKRKPKRIPDPHDVYLHATRFLVADSILRKSFKKRPSPKKWVSYPAMVNSAFASELFLKCLLILEGKSPPGTHDLETLFSSLNAAHKARIRALWKAKQPGRERALATVERENGKTIPRDLVGALRDCANAFELIRYMHESPKKAKFYLTFFPIHVRDVIRQVRPDWTE